MLMNFRTMFAATLAAFAALLTLSVVPATANATAVPAARRATHFNTRAPMRISPNACRWTATLLTDGTDSPVPHAVVNLFRDGGQTQSSSTDAGGGVTFTLSVKPGNAPSFIMKFPGNNNYIASQSPSAQLPC
jgi:hypothetical protein